MKTKEELIAKLISMGAVKDLKVENIYWLNGHCVMIKETEFGWILDEL